jgi:hypothetical protein
VGEEMEEMDLGWHRTKAVFCRVLRRWALALNGAAGMVAGMVTTTKKSATAKKPVSKSAAARRVKKKPNRLGLVPGYASHLCSIRPGYDLTQPTYPVLSR